MKKTLIIIALAVLSISTSCNKTDNSKKTQTELATKARYETSDFYNTLSDNIGLVHNAALDYAFTQIQANGQFDPNTDQDVIIPYMNQYFLQYFKNNGQIFPQDFYNTFVKQHTINYTYSDAYNALKAQVDKQYDAASNPAEFKTFAINFASNNITGLNNKESIALKSYVLVLANSYEYWTNNSSKWEAAINTAAGLAVKGTAASQGRINVRTVAKADAEGGTMGAITGGYTGALLGGIGAIPGAINGAVWGAVGGSLMNLCFQAVIKGWGW